MIDEKTLEEFVAKQSITELINSYLMCIEEKNFSVRDLGRFFAEKVSMKFPFSKHVSSVKDVAEIYQVHLTQFDFVHHIPGGYIFRFSSSCAADIQCYLYVMYKRKASPQLLTSIELLHCSVRRNDTSNNDWRISGLEIKTVYTQETQ
ncbi:MAG: hypothetical protein IJG37_07570 [Synergistaceae bacterium]|nr:hypothetical protein [Synergistaceae bacterium]MBQ7169741.1 hypothetical protein [Synergistaceae bacterium]